MSTIGQDSLKTRRTLTVGGQSYDYFSLKAASEQIGDISRLPYSMKVVLENLLRHEDGRSVSTDDIKSLVQWVQDRTSTPGNCLSPGTYPAAGFHGRSRCCRSRGDA